MHHLYPIDLILYSDRISRRKVSGYIMEANIAILPHRKPEDAQNFMNALYERRSELEGVAPETQKLDRAGLAALKAQLADNSKTVKVK